MNEYMIYTDTGCDILPDKLAEWGVRCIDLTFNKEGETVEYTQADVPTKRFYDLMREGVVFRTAAANELTIKAAIEPALKDGLDVLYLAFGSGLSSTANTAKLTAEELMKAYPGRRVTVIDSLCASAGHGLLLWFAVDAKRRGADMDEVEAVVMKNLPGLCHSGRSGLFKARRQGIRGGGLLRRHAEYKARAAR